MRRVVVTGIGAVTPVGNSVPEFADAIFSGRCGIAPITKFDASDSKCRLAAEVKGFDPSPRLDKTTVRKTDVFTQHALYAAEEAMEILIKAQRECEELYMSGDDEPVLLRIDKDKQ